VTLSAEVLAIGDELVYGRSVDTNSAWLARRLADLGLPVVQISVVGDGEEYLRRAISTACQRSDIVVVTGGLGPTEDDRTRRVVAKVCGEPLRFDEASWRDIQTVLKVYTQQGRAIPVSNRLQAEFPESAQVLKNDCGSAPGFFVEVGGCTLYALPGVPREMYAMWDAHVQPILRTRSDQQVHAHNLHVVGYREADLGERLQDFMIEGQAVKVGITASRGQLTIRILGFDRGLVDSAATAIRPLLGEHLIYEGEHSLEEEVGRQLIKHGVTIALAESCTGGLMAAALTEIPGISSVFLAGFVTYSEQAKSRDLGVDAAILTEHGVVSESVAAAMARGAATKSGARLAISVTGIAGPDGGTPEQPVGTVCFGLYFDGETSTLERRFGDLGRELLRQRSVREGLVWLCRTLARID